MKALPAEVVAGAEGRPEGAVQRGQGRPERRGGLTGRRPLLQAAQDLLPQQVDQPGHDLAERPHTVKPTGEVPGIRVSKAGGLGALQATGDGECDELMPPARPRPGREVPLCPASPRVRARPPVTPGRLLLGPQGEALAWEGTGLPTRTSRPPRCTPCEAEPPG